MSEPVPASLVRLIRQRAGEACEYCRLPQWSQEATFHLDHIHPLADGGLTTEDAKSLAGGTVTPISQWRVSENLPLVFAQRLAKQRKITLRK